MIKKFSIYFVVFALGALLSLVYVTHAKDKEIIQSNGYAILANIGETIDIINTLKDQGAYTDTVHKKLNQQLISNTIILRALNPNIVEYSAIPKIGFCRLLDYNDAGELSNGSDPALFDLANGYLAANKSKVLTSINQSQKILGGVGCNIGGAGGICPFKDKSLCNKKT